MPSTLNFNLLVNTLLLPYYCLLGPFFMDVDYLCMVFWVLLCESSLDGQPSKADELEDKKQEVGEDRAPGSVGATKKVRIWKNEVEGSRDLPDHPSVEWDTSLLSALILKHIESNQIDLVVQKKEMGRACSRRGECHNFHPTND
uniref:Uncharacterized protein n=1 Tax=Sphaerodactylus townsendi TaxID=933632 RepID=A0ACB8ECK0_9SAUR